MERTFHSALGRSPGPERATLAVNRAKVCAMSRDRELRIHGVAACRAVFEHRPEAIRRAFLEERHASNMSRVLKYLADRRVAYHVVEREDLERVTGGKHHEGVCFYIDPLPAPSFDTLVAELAIDDRPALLVYLDGVRNPHNLGAIARSAAHFGVRAMLVSRDAPNFGPAAIRVAEGGAEVVPIVPVPSLATPWERLRDIGFSLWAADGPGEKALHQAEVPSRLVYILGAERWGLSEEMRSEADATVRIAGTGKVESLNVSVASAVLFAAHAAAHGDFA